MELAKLIKQVRKELQDAEAAPGEGRLALRECELEVAVEISEKGGGDLEFKILGTGVKIAGEGASTSIQTMKLKFSALPNRPIDEIIRDTVEIKEKAKSAGLSPEDERSILGNLGIGLPVFIHGSLAMPGTDLGSPFLTLPFGGIVPPTE